MINVQFCQRTHISCQSGSLVCPGEQQTSKIVWKKNCAELKGYSKLVFDRMKFNCIFAVSNSVQPSPRSYQLMVHKNCESELSVRRQEIKKKIIGQVVDEQTNERTNERVSEQDRAKLNEMK